MIWFPAFSPRGIVMAQAKLLNQLWVSSGASYTFNVCTTAATDSVKGWHTLVELYDYLLSLADHRVAQWPLMSSPWPTLLITIAYLYLVYAGPRFMSNRKPVELKPLLLLYNASVAGLNLYIGLELFLTSQKLDFSWTCEPVDYTLNPLALRVASALWYTKLNFGSGKRNIFTNHLLLPGGIMLPNYWRCSIQYSLSYVKRKNS